VYLTVANGHNGGGASSKRKRMSEDENVVQDETPVQEEQQLEQPQVQEKVEAPKEDLNQVNWRQANEVMRLQKQRIEELEQMREQRYLQPKVEEEVDEFANEDPDNYITVEKARKMADKAAEKKAKVYAQQAVQEYAAKQSVAVSEDKARSKYEDYDYVIENFVVPMIKNDPAYAYKIQQSKNPAETAYKLGILSDDYEASMTKAPVSPKAEKILKNTQRPTSSNAAGSLKTQADKYSNMTQSEIWAESQKYARRA
jgi:hypothetical protein